MFLISAVRSLTFISMLISYIRFDLQCDALCTWRHYDPQIRMRRSFRKSETTLH